MVNYFEDYKGGPKPGKQALISATSDGNEKPFELSLIAGVDDLKPGDLLKADGTLATSKFEFFGILMEKDDRGKKTRPPELSAVGDFETRNYIKGEPISVAIGGIMCIEGSYPVGTLLGFNAASDSLEEKDEAAMDESFLMVLHQYNDASAVIKQ